MQNNNKYYKFYTDIAIAGASFAGICLAIAIKQYCPKLKIILIEPQDLSAQKEDQRAYAIALDIVKMLKKLNIWQYVADSAQIINNMRLNDTYIEEPIRFDLLNIHSEINSALGYIIPAQILKQALLKRAKELELIFYDKYQIADFSNGAELFIDIHDIKGSDNFKIKAQLLVAADGKNSLIRKKSNIKSNIFNYNQDAIVCKITHDKAHNATALQNFFPNGSFAVLPLKGNFSSIVWSEKSQIAENMLKSPQEELLTEIQKRCGNFVGKIKLASRVQKFPLALILPQKFISERILLIGDAAHTIHPICGQGLNLGFRDCAIAAEIIVNAARLGLDIGSYNLLEDYQLARRSDVILMGLAGDFINRLFSNNINILRFVRDFALSYTDKNEKLKNLFIKLANSGQNSSAKLLQGKEL